MALPGVLFAVSAQVGGGFENDQNEQRSPNLGPSGINPANKEAIDKKEMTGYVNLIAAPRVAGYFAGMLYFVQDDESL